jgi:hypothetical protein
VFGVAQVKMSAGQSNDVLSVLVPAAWNQFRTYLNQKFQFSNELDPLLRISTCEVAEKPQL